MPYLFGDITVNVENPIEQLALDFCDFESRYKIVSHIILNSTTFEILNMHTDQTWTKNEGQSETTYLGEFNDFFGHLQLWGCAKVIFNNNVPKNKYILFTNS